MSDDTVGLFLLDTSQVGVTGGKDVVGLAGRLVVRVGLTEAMLGFMRTTSMPSSSKACVTNEKKECKNVS
jgi:hypothetical protein